MTFAAWCLIAGALMVVMALSGSLLQRLPLTASMFYLAFGFVLGPALLGVLELPPLHETAILERITEAAVVISLFTAGLKLRAPLTRGHWTIPVRLATLSMVLTVGMIAAVAFYGLDLPLGGAILLGAILAPTDPVLASGVQLSDPFDRDRLRFGLTGEAGLNDGTAFPFVMLGLGLLGLHDIGGNGWRWWTIDLLWAITGGLGIGALLGTGIARLVIYLRQEHREALGLDEFLTIGLIGIAYGTALLLHTYGFLAVFASAIALRRVEMAQSGNRSTDEICALAKKGPTEPQGEPAYMAQAVLGFNEKLERIAEFAVVVVLGSLLSSAVFPSGTWWFVLVLLLLIRPLSVFAGSIGSNTSTLQRSLMSWFGIHGVGSLYYFAYAVSHGLPRDLATQLGGIVLATVTTSITVHGISVTPLMNAYARKHR